MRRLLYIVLLLALVADFSLVLGQSYFRVIGELPHLPMVDPVTIATPQTGMLVFSSSDSKPLIYTGSTWESLCTTNISAATTQDYFVVKDGIPFLPVFGAAPSGLLVSGTIYYSTSSNAVMVYNGSVWSKMVDMPGGTFSLNSSFSSGVDVKTIKLPVLNSDPTIPGLSAGAFYINASSHSIRYYTGSLWLDVSCQAVVTTLAPSNIAGYTAIGGGDVVSNGSSPVTLTGLCWSPDANPDTLLTSKTRTLRTGSGIGVFTDLITGLLPNTSYHVRAYAVNSLGLVYGQDVVFSTPVAPPTIITLPVSQETSISAQSGGDISADGGSPVTHRGVIWSSLSDPLNDDSHTVIDDGSGVGYFPSTLDWLLGNTTYYVRAYAVNVAGTAYGNLIVFTTPPPEVPKFLSSAKALSTVGDSATAMGTLMNNGGALVTSRGICYRVSGSNSQTCVASSTVTLTDIGSFVSTLTNLLQGTTYYIKGYAVNSVGIGYSTESSFVTPSLTTIVTTPPVTTGGTTADGGGEITNSGYTVISARGVCWDTLPNPTINLTTKTSDAVLDDGTGVYSSSLSGLTPGLTYYVRAYAINSAGVAYGNLDSLLTAALPTLTTAHPNAVSNVHAIAGGTISDDGREPVTSRGVCWSLRPNPTIAFSDSLKSMGSDIGSFSDTINNLLGSKKYYIRAYATNNVGTGYGSLDSLTTLAPGLSHVETTSVQVTHGATASVGAIAGAIGNVRDNGGALVSERGFCWSTVDIPMHADSHVISGQGNGTFTANLTGLVENTNYYVRAYALNGIGIAYGNLDSITTPISGYPAVSTTDAINITTSSVTMRGNVADDGGGAIRERGFCWSSSLNPVIGDPGVSVVISALGGGTGSFSGDLSGLSPGTTYHFRAYAINSRGTSYGNDLPFSTYTFASIVTKPATSVSSVGAASGGAILNDGGRPVTQSGICWSTSVDPTIADLHTTRGTGIRDFTDTITNSLGSTTYYIRAYAINAAGIAYGADETFTTLPPVYPSITSTGGKSADTGTSASCGGQLNSNGGALILSKGILWSTTSGFTPTITSSDKTVLTGEGDFSSTLTNLTPGTTYYFRAYATNSVGTRYADNELSFTTCDQPTVITLVPFSTTNVGTTTGGNITSTGGLGILESGVCWSTATLPTINDEHQLNAGGIIFSSTITELMGNTTYYVRAYAKNSLGLSYGQVETFTTLAPMLATIQTLQPTATSPTTATMGGKIVSHGGSPITTRGVYWSTTSGFTPSASVSHTADTGSFTGSYGSGISGLTPNTMYYVRAYVINGLGTSYGAEINFRTFNAFSITTKPATSITSTGAQSGGNILSDGGFKVYCSGICWNSTGNPVMSNYNTIGGPGIGEFIHGISNLTGSATYYIRAYALNDTGVHYGQQEVFTTLPPDNPILTTTVVGSGRTGTTGTCGGIINSNGGAPILSKGILWSTISGFIPSITSPNKTILSGDGNFSSTFGSLLPATTYYARAYATNNAGTGYAGNEVSFTTFNVPELTTTVPYSVTNVTVNTGGTIVSNGGQPILDSGVCWSTSNSPTIADNYLNGGSAYGLFIKTLTELMGSTTYYVRSYATNSVGTGYGEVESFTTQPPMLATILTTTPVATSSVSGSAGGNIISHGGAMVTTRGIYWSTTPDFVPSSSVAHTAQTGYFTGTFVDNMPNLLPNTIYYVRAYVVNSVGTAYGAQMNFKTPTLPVLSTQTAISNGPTKASSGGTIIDDGGAPIRAKGIVWSKVPGFNPDTVTVYRTSDGAGSSSFTSLLAGLKGSTTYYVQAYAVNVAGTGYGNLLSFITDPPKLATLTTSDVSSLSGTAATAGGTISDNGGEPILTRGMVWSQYPGFRPDTVVYNKNLDGAMGLGAFSSTMTGLKRGTTYYIRAYATNSVGIAFGNELSFTTYNLPVLTTESVSPDALGTTASGGGVIQTDGGTPITNQGICWNTTSGPTIGLFTKTSGDVVSHDSIRSALTNLTPGTTYYVRAYAVNSEGTSYGNEVSFTTPPAIPILTTTYATITSLSSITTGGKISTDNGAPVLSRGVVWSTDLNFNPDTVTVNRTVNGSGTGSFISIITGMQQRIFYYIKAYAVNSVGTGYGNLVTVTLFPTSPVLETTEVTGLGGTTALSGGRIISDGGAVVTVKGVCWNIKTNPTTDNSHTYNGSGNDPYTANITGLLPNTMYYVRAYAINKIGTAYGPEKVILTNNIPTLAATTPATNIIATVATSGGEVTDDGRSPILYRGICWSTYPDPDISLATKTVDSTSHVIGSFTANMKGLTPNRTYYVRAYATNAVGTGYGSMIQFTTLPVRLPTLTTLTPLPLDSATALSGGNITDDGGMPITDRGVCWSRYRNFTIVGSLKAYDHIRDTIGTYNDSVVGMDPGTKYYVKAFAINSKGTAYGNLDSLVTPAVLARVSSVMISNITKFSANALASVITDGGDSVTVRGFCWNRTGRPTIANDTLQVGNGIGSFADTLKNLVEGKTYYVRAFAINSIGIAYSTIDASFQICPTAFTVLHVEGLNGAPVTKTVTYGSVSTNISGAAKCWITQNLGADHQAVSATDGTEPSAGWYWQFNRAQGYKHDGTTRTPATWIATINENSDWIPANDPCNLLLANGWRMPTSTEWTNADGAPQNWANITDAYNSILKLHAGGYLYNGAMTLKGSSGEFWSSTQANATIGIYLNSTTSSSSIVNNTNNAKSAYGFSLRCLRDSVVISAPLVSDVTITGKSNTAVTATAAASPDGGAPVTARGFCWNTTGTPTMTDHLIAEGNSIGIFTDSITGLVEGTTYYIRAYATNRIGTTYNSTVTQFKVCPPQFTVQHIAGMNGAPVAKTVVYHSISTTLSGAARCWITQNLGADNIATSLTDATEPSAGWYWQFNRSQGYKHDGTTRTPTTTWISTINESSDWLSANDPCSRLLGGGWRMPTSLEYSNVIANGGVPFNSLLKLHNSGYLNANTGVLYSRGATQGNYWSTTSTSTTNAYELYNVGSSLVNDYKPCGFPVRCLRDTLVISAPSVSDVTFTAMTSTSTDVLATATPDGGAPITDRGFCWNTTGVPTTADNIVSSGLGLGTFTGTVTGGLVQGPTYYVRAYATNKIGVAYSNVNSFKICPDTFSITHLTGFNGVPVSKKVLYHSVSSTLSGKAVCWTTQNLGADQQATALTDATEPSAGWYWQFNRIQGYKHDGTTRTPATTWISTINESSDWLSANDPCSRLLGSGWRMPTSLEYSNVIANGGVPFNSPLKLHNSGYLNANTGVLYSRGVTQGNYWSTTSTSATNAYELYNVGSSLVNDYKPCGFPVRCLRDTLVLSAPSVSGVTFTAMTSTSTDVSAIVTPDGGAPVTERGFCWNTTGVPTTADNVVSSGLGLGTFTGTVTGGLLQGPTYYVRAYAVNRIGITYGTVNSFRICPAAFTVQHIAGIAGAPVSKTVTYNSVSSTLSGKAVCWLTQNLGADQQASAMNDATEASAGWYWQFNRIQGFKHDGTTRTPALSWIAINETSDWIAQNDPCTQLLGSGWRIPTSLEYSNVITNGGDPFASPLKLFYAGILVYNTGGLYIRGVQGNYWSSTGGGATTAYNFKFSTTQPFLANDDKAYGFPLRCLRDAIVIAPPVVGQVTVDASSMTGTSAGVSAAVGSDGGASVSARGFCWNLTGNPTLSDNHITDAAVGTGNFAGTITGLTYGPKYYIRAYATNTAGTAYSEGTGFNAVLTDICPDTFNIQHTVGFRGAPVSKTVTYHAIQTSLSGATHCWITQNLGADHQASSLTDATEASSGWYFQFNRSQGYKHDGTTHTPVPWVAAINEASAWISINDPCSIMLGVDWRIPTVTEYSSILSNGGVSFTSALKLHYSGIMICDAAGSSTYRGSYGIFWSSSAATNTNGNYLQFSAGSQGIVTNPKAYGFPVRCLRDALAKIPPTLGAVVVPTATMTDSTAQGTATILQDGGSPITERGLCWNTTGIPTITDHKVIYSASDMTYTSLMTGLTAGVTYYVRAYAVNKIGLSYSPTVTSFKKCNPVNAIHVAGFNGAPVSKSVSYGTVATSLSGKLMCWTTQNLGADQQANSATDATEASAGWYWAFNRSQGYKHDGTTLTPVTWTATINESSDWVSANDPCNLLLGSGWRVPTNTEWTSAAGAPQSWANSANTYSSVLKLHGGGYLASGALTSRGVTGEFWSATQVSATNAGNLGFNTTICIIETGHGKSAFGSSLRCIRDSVLVSRPSVSNVTITGKSKTAVTITAVAVDNGAPVIARGFYWNTTGNPTIADHVAPEGNNIGAFTDSITGLVEGTTYYIQAYATNRVGTAYSSTVTQFKVCLPQFTVQHVAGFNGVPVSKTVTYNSVSSTLSGKAVCWITQNLGADQQATTVTDATESSAGWYWQFNRIQGFKHDGTTRTPATSWITAISEASDWLPANDPCNRLLGTGWRIPTSLEYSNVITNGGVPFSSPLKLHNSGYLAWNAGGMVNGRGTTQGNYWSTTSVSATTAFDLYNVGSSMVADNKANSFSLRCLRDALVLSAPSVSDVAFSNMTSTSADVLAAVTPDGGAPVTERGFCWNTAGTPTTADNIVSGGLGVGAFSGTIAGSLVQGPTYYVRAYAINKIGISYGTVNSFKICPAAFSVQHIAGIDGAPVSKVVTYNSVSSTLSGKAVCWITQNLGADQQATVVTDATDASAGWYWQFNRIQGFKNDGTTRTPALSWIAIDETSDWVSANDPCTRLLGSGWRIPTSTEYTNVITNGGIPFTAPLKLHYGGYLSNAGSLLGRNTYGIFWSSSANTSTIATYLQFSSGVSAIYSNIANSKGSAFTLRCLRDAIVIALPSVGQVVVDASSLTGTLAGVSAAVGSDGGAPVNARGFCWNLTGNPTLSDNHITDAATGTGNFAGTITGLTVGPKYYIRAYATNSAGTAYSEGTGFNAVLTSICPDTFNIQHTVGFRGVPVTKAVTYHAVQTSLSGAAQCWITQNLGADHPATSAFDATEASAGWYFQFNRSLGYKNDGTTSTPVAWATSISETSDWTLINDPCSIMLGVGWRLPTSTEWSNAHGAPQNWAAYADSYNSVLKIHGAGYLSTAGSLASRGTEGIYWSSTSTSNINASAYEFYSALNVLTSVTKAYGFSVRCLR